MVKKKQSKSKMVYLISIRVALHQNVYRVIGNIRIDCKEINFFRRKVTRCSRRIVDEITFLRPIMFKLRDNLE